MLAKRDAVNNECIALKYFGLTNEEDIRKRYIYKRKLMKYKGKIFEAKLVEHKVPLMRVRDEDSFDFRNLQDKVAAVVEEHPNESLSIYVDVDYDSGLEDYEIKLEAPLSRQPTKEELEEQIIEWKEQIDRREAAHNAAQAYKIGEAIRLLEENGYECRKK